MHYQAVSLSDMVVAVQSACSARYLHTDFCTHPLPPALFCHLCQLDALDFVLSSDHIFFLSGLDRHWESHVYCGKKGVSWDLQQPTAAILSAIMQHLSGISSRTAQTRASSAIVATGADESMDHDWAVSTGLDPTLTLTSATGNISQFTSDAYFRSHVLLMLRSATELTMQAMVSLAPKVSQMGVYNRNVYVPCPLFMILLCVLNHDVFFVPCFLLFVFLLDLQQLLRFAHPEQLREPAAFGSRGQAHAFQGRRSLQPRSFGQVGLFNSDAEVTFGPRACPSNGE
jgi:hypothetical protein